MNFTKTFCRPSSTVAVVPAGLPIKLQYNQFGIIQSMSIGFDSELDSANELCSEAVDKSRCKQAFQRIKQFVPNSISLSGGTTWIYGIMYTDKIPCTEGPLPVALYDAYIEDILAGGWYEFYAGYVHSLAASFQGAMVMKKFLSTNGFRCLPQMIVPVSMSDQTLEMMLNTNSFPFKYPFVAGFLIFEELKCRYASSNLLQICVTNDPEPFVDIDGYLKGEVKTESGRTYIFNYSAIIHHGISKGCTLLAERSTDDSALQVLATRLGPQVDKVTETINHDIKCPVCGKVYRAGANDAPVQCDDPHCLSHEYYTAKKMMDTFKLPSFSYESYKALVDSKKIVCITDLLDLPICKEIEIKTTLAEAMYAAIPTSVVPSIEILERFANKCNNKVESVVYYLENPLRIETDLDIVDPIVNRLAKWLQDPYNVSTLTTIFSRVDISAKMQKFDGAPIFRGNKIAVTGRFKRGDYPEIEAILMSYAATVVPSIEKGQDLPDILLIGSTNEGISGQMVQKAKLHNIPISYEDDFFVRYEIDKDMAENLL